MPSDFDDAIAAQLAAAGALEGPPEPSYELKRAHALACMRRQQASDDDVRRAMKRIGRDHAEIIRALARGPGDDGKR